MRCKLKNQVRATSVILLLGVGSFVCYKVYQQLKQRLKKSQESNTTLKHPRLLDWLSDELLNADVPENPQCIEGRYFGPENTSEDISDISDSPGLDSSDASLGDRVRKWEFSSESDEFVMGNTASNSYDGAVYHKGYGIHFKRRLSAGAPSSDACNNRCQQFHASSKAVVKETPTSSIPVVHSSRNESWHRKLPGSLIGSPSKGYSQSRRKNWVFNSQQSQDFESSTNSILFEAGMNSQDAASLVGNFSPSSLKERNFLANKEYFPTTFSDINESTNSEIINDDFSEDSPAFVFDPFIPPLSREISLDSASSFTDLHFQKYGRLSNLARETSIDSEISDFSSLELCKPTVEEPEFGTVEKLDELQNEIQDIKQSVLDLDAEFVGLKVYRKPPMYGWTIADISLTEMGPNSLSENSSNDVLDLVKHHKTKVWCKGLIHSGETEADTSSSSEKKVFSEHEDPKSKNSDSLRTNAGSDASLPWDSPRPQKKAINDDNKEHLHCKIRKLSSQSVGKISGMCQKMPLVDSGSDFGNSLDSDSVDVDLSAQQYSLEWDPGSLCDYPCEQHDSCNKMPSASYSNTSIMGPASPQLHMPTASDQQVDNAKVCSTLADNVRASRDVIDGVGSAKCRCWRSVSTPAASPGVLAEQIQMIVVQAEVKKVCTKLKRSLTAPCCSSTPSQNVLTQGFADVSEKDLPTKLGSDVTGSSESSSFVALACTGNTEKLKESGYHGELSSSSRMCPSSSSQQLDAQQLDNFYLGDNCVVNRPTLVDKHQSFSNNVADQGGSFNHERTGCDQNGNSVHCFNVNTEDNRAVQSLLLKDSAYCDSSSSEKESLAEVISKRIGMVDYCQNAHDVESCVLIQECYQRLPMETECQAVRRIRNDNYCAIQATLFQMLSSGLPILQNHGGATAVYHKLETWMQGCCPWLHEWTFAHHLPQLESNGLQGFWECLIALEKMEDELRSSWNREQELTESINNNPSLCLYFAEAVKLLMFVTARDLYQQLQADEPVPMFVMLLFARESSHNPREFMLNHLNHVGDSRALEQVEMFLLGYTLSVTMKVIRPEAYGSNEFICHYPESNIGRWPEIILIENNRRFDVVIR